ncbi:hypothetical protein FOA52_015036 [Chlamydomonas sp. UWO 241]|nr:hypothetical protein FOA52_015036 [Chlamydomonas sp. UWO 241]
MTTDGPILERICVTEGPWGLRIAPIGRGRLCLFGEHSDWAGEHRGTNPEIPAGMCIVVGTQEGLHASARRDSRNVLTLRATSHSGEVLGPKEFPLEPAALLAEAQQGGFWSYAAGTAYRIVTQHDVAGLSIDNHTTTLPMGKGLSSSAAVCVLVARAFNKVYDLKLTIRGEMEFAYQGEVTTPSKCGRMDQACAYGPIPVLMVFDADVLRIDTIKLRGTLHLVLVDLNAAKDTTTILKAMQAAYPNAENEAEKRLHGLLGDVNHNICGRAMDALTSGDLPKLGELMREAQHEFDARAGPMCSSQLTAPALHKVLDHPSLQPLIWGAKGVGSQGDGTAQLLCRGASEQRRVLEVLESELGLSPMPLTVHGADFVLSIAVARGANWFLAGGGRRTDEEEATAAAAERIAAAAEDGTSLPVRLATDVVRFLYGGTGRREPADGGVVSASLLNAKPAVGGIGVEPRGGGVLRVLFTVASDAVADTVVRWRHELRRCVDSTAVFDVLSDREEAQHQALWPAFLAAKVAGKRAQFHRARLVVDGERHRSINPVLNTLEAELQAAGHTEHGRSPSCPAPLEHGKHSERGGVALEGVERTVSGEVLHRCRQRLSMDSLLRASPGVSSRLSLCSSPSLPMRVDSNQFYQLSDVNDSVVSPRRSVHDVVAEVIRDVSVNSMSEDEKRGATGAMIAAMAREHAARGEYPYPT